MELSNRVDALEGRMRALETKKPEPERVSRSQAKRFAVQKGLPEPVCKGATAGSPECAIRVRTDAVRDQQVTARCDKHKRPVPCSFPGCTP